MKTYNKDEKEARERKFTEKRPATERCCPEGMPEMITNCCKDVGEGRPAGMAEMREKCCDGMKKMCRWVPVIPLVLGGASFLLGYYLSNEIVRALWLGASGFVVLLGLVSLTMANVIYRT